MQFLVCATKGNFADDVSTRCARCDAPIEHRPHVSADLVKICLDCATDQFKSDPRTTIEVTEEMLREVALYYMTPKGGTQ